MQRPGKTHAAGAYDAENVSLGSLIKFVRAAKEDLLDAGDQDSAVRFEILEDWLREDFKGGPLKYTQKAIGL
jgi:hypothetical protein